VRHSHCFLQRSVAQHRAPFTRKRVTRRDRNRKAFDRRNGLAHEVVMMLLLRWIAVAAVLLGIAALASADRRRANDAGVDARGTQCVGTSPRCGEETR
jgi:hypothetical protein